MSPSRDAGIGRRAVLAGTVAGAASALTGLTPTSAQARSHTQSAFGTIRNDTFWHDTDGNPIYSQGGGVFRFGDRYYWYGVRYAGGELYYANPTRRYDTYATFVAITAYSSSDLVNWTFEGNIATTATPLHIPPSKDVAGDSLSRVKTLSDTSWLGRLGVMYNPNTRKYVLVTQMKSAFDENPTGRALLFLQSDTPTGDFTYADIQTHIENVGHQGTGDQTVFTDDDGSSYLVFSNPSGRQNSYISKISDADSLSIEPAKKVGYTPAGREGNAMFKLNGIYYIATSDLHGWNSSHTYIIESRTQDILGEYSSEYILPGTEKDYSHVTQTGFFITIKGTKQDAVIYAGDRWADFAWNGLGYNQWVPLSMRAGRLIFHSLSEWKLNARTGQWREGRGNNYILNPDFAADRVPVTTLTGWTTTVDTGFSTNPFLSTTSPGANGSRFAATLGSPGAFSGSVSQEFDVPPGIYRLTATARATQELRYARIMVRGGRGESYVLDLTQTTYGWQERALGNLCLTSGRVSISIEARSQAPDQKVFVDSLSLVRAGTGTSQPTSTAS
ncbi:family 43 glycosylhydrolase [Streptomyces sp. NPDC102282]|uniref:family 43 glycosylhydrolase n=1 Tax=Streptomyces sp. NPDC102282 TaxID=3366154 RepID=UPI00380A0468